MECFAGTSENVTLAQESFTWDPVRRTERTSGTTLRRSGEVRPVGRPSNTCPAVSWWRGEEQRFDLLLWSQWWDDDGFEWLEFLVLLIPCTEVAGPRQAVPAPP